MTHDLDKLAAGLTEPQRASIMSLWPGERVMGGWGADTGCPGLIEAVGINHPIFGSHYRLTELGIALRHHLLAKDPA